MFMRDSDELRIEFKTAVVQCAQTLQPMLAGKWAESRDG